MCMHVRVNVCECVPSQQIWRSAEGVLYTPPDDGSQSDFVPTVTTSKNVVRNLELLVLFVYSASYARIQRKDRVGKRGGGVDEDEEYLEQLSKQLAAQKLGVLVLLRVCCACLFHPLFGLQPLRRPQLL